MPTSTDVANKALRRLYIPSIDSIDDVDNDESIQCKAEYDDVRQQYLREAAPGFARKEAALALVSGETSVEYTYVYGYPADCLKSRRIYNPAGLDADPIVYETGQNTAGNSKLVFTDQEDATLIYTADVTNLNMFSTDGISSMALLLAHRVAILKRNESLAGTILNEYILQLSVAKKNDKRDQKVNLRKNTRYSDARR
jgi:hypothetical protein